ncbi:MAG: response regulator [Gammaproteobacteria bacterium]|jgi:PAS domain S-box-containing protein|nr:response regulator [Gammaproteobacteria bacterium]
MSIRSKLLFYLGIVLALNLAVGLYAFQAYKQATGSAEQVIGWANRIVTTSLSAQVHFKKQVQEWKNVLLRGHEPDLYDKYLNQFNDEERVTRQEIETLLELLAEDSDIRNTANAFYRAHKKLGVEYRDALAFYDRANEAPHIPVDERVRGIDREPTDLLDEAVNQTLEEKETRLAAIWSEAAQAGKRTLLVAFGVLTLAVVLIMWSADYAIGKPISTATGIARRISQGDLDGRIDVKGRSETAQLLLALRTMQENLDAYQNDLRRSEARTRLLLDSSGEGIYGIDTRGRCMFINPAGVAILKYQNADELLGREMHTLIHHTRADGSHYPIDECPATQSCLTGGSCRLDDEVFWCADGSRIPVEYRSYPIHQGGRLAGAVVLFSDITKRKQAEAELNRAHRALQVERELLAERVEERTAELNMTNVDLARSVRTKDEFLAAMSHEFRTPLTTIMGTSEMLSDGLYGPLSESQEQAVSSIEESSQHLLSLINDILDVAKVEAGKIEMTSGEVSVPELCEASLRLVRQPAAAKHLKLSFDLDPAVRTIAGDARRLKQLLVNLLSNAVKFTPEFGRIGMEVRGNAASQVAEFVVWDKGIGITEEDMSRLFKPFVQLDNPMNRNYSGTGLGLVLAYRMAELHGGGISVESTPGQGSRFTVTLPWSAAMPRSYGQLGAAGVSDDTGERGPLPGTGIRVLLAEDHETNSDMLTEALESMEFQVSQARDGVEALAMARRVRPDIILMDLQMPNLDGLEATRRLRADPELNGTAVIALTALTMPGDRERCFEAGVNDYLEKPVGVREMVRTIHRHLPATKQPDAPRL